MVRIKKNINGEIWIRVSEDNNAVRYILGTQGQRTLCCLGINPSTADLGCPDPTVRSVIRIAKNNGYDSFLMLNVYPMRCTVFENLSHRENQLYKKRNLIEIEKILSKLPQPIDIWIAHGNLIDQRSYTRPCLEQLKAVFDQYNCRYFHTGFTKANNPRHPLYLKSTTKLQNFNWL